MSLRKERCPLCGDMVGIGSVFAQHISECPAREKLPHSKYNAQRVEYDGYTFDSRMEANHYFALKQLLKKGEITDLEVHPRYDLHAQKPNGKAFIVGQYEADFAYVDANGKKRYIDIKGVETSLFKWKRRHFEIEHAVKLEVINPR